MLSSSCLYLSIITANSNPAALVSHKKLRGSTIMCTSHAGNILESSINEKRKGCTSTQNHKFIQRDILMAVGSSTGQNV